MQAQGPGVVPYVHDLDIEVGRGGAGGGGFNVRGNVANVAALVPIAQIGEHTIGDIFITDNDRHGHMWDGDTFIDLGQIFPPGPTGSAGGEGVTGPVGNRGPAGPTGPTG